MSDVSVFVFSSRCLFVMSLPASVRLSLSLSLCLSLFMSPQVSLLLVASLLAVSPL